MKTTFHDFMTRAKAVHGGRYDYSKVDYKTTEAKVVIVCPDHGEFLMRPRAHYQDKRGCPDCDDGTKSGFSNNSKWAKIRPKFFYIIEVFAHDERFLKIGLTVEDIDSRFLKGQFPYDYRVIFSGRVPQGRPEELHFIEKYKLWNYRPKQPFKGQTECIQYNQKKSILEYAKTYFSKQS